MTTGLSRDEACDLLAAAGFTVDRRTAALEPRDDRWAMSLPGDLMAWFPMNEAAAARLAVERRAAPSCAARGPRGRFRLARAGVSAGPLRSLHAL